MKSVRCLVYNCMSCVKTKQTRLMTERTLSTWPSLWWLDILITQGEDKVGLRHGNVSLVSRNHTARHDSTSREQMDSVHVRAARRHRQSLIDAQCVGARSFNRPQLHCKRIVFASLINKERQW